MMTKSDKHANWLSKVASKSHWPRMTNSQATLPAIAKQSAPFKHPLLVSKHLVQALKKSQWMLQMILCFGGLSLFILMGQSILHGFNYEWVSPFWQQIMMIMLSLVGLIVLSAYAWLMWTTSWFLESLWRWLAGNLLLIQAAITQNTTEFLWLNCTWVLLMGQMMYEMHLLRGDVLKFEWNLQVIVRESTTIFGMLLILSCSRKDYLGLLITWLILRSLPWTELSSKALVNHIGKKLRQLQVASQNLAVALQLKGFEYVILDKTETLTEPMAEVDFVTIKPGVDQHLIWSLLVSLEENQNHPVAQGINQFARANGGEVLPLKQWSKILMGIGADWQGNHYVLVSRSAVRQLGLEPQLKNNGKTMSYLVKNQQVILAEICLTEKLKPQARALVQLVKRWHWVTVMATGDNDSNANQVGVQLGLDVIAADLTSQMKAQVVQAYQKQGRVIYLGDGRNDQLALQLADLGISLADTSLPFPREKQAHLIIGESSLDASIQVLQLLRKGWLKNWLDYLVWWGLNLIVLMLLIYDFPQLHLTIIGSSGALLLSLLFNWCNYFFNRFINNIDNNGNIR